MNTIEVEAKLFNLYSALFCQPDEALFENLNILTELEQLQCSLNNGAYENGFSLKEACLEYSPNELLIDYTSIFLGPFSIVAYPYSSVYFTNGVKTLNSETTQWVLDYYQTGGFKFNDGLQDMPDHITVELEFLYLLKYYQFNYLNKGENDKALEMEKKSKDFINKHFGIWIPKFCKKVIESGENQYYINLCFWLKGFVSNYLLMKQL